MAGVGKQTVGTVTTTTRSPVDVTLPGPLGVPVGTWVKAAVLGVAFVAMFHHWFHIQAVHSWDKKQDWGHSFVMPLVGLYLLWQQRAGILGTPARTFWPGVLPFATGIVGYAFFLMGFSNHMMQGYCMIMALAGLALLLLGPGLFKYFFIPIAVQVFAVMISERIMQEATFPLQLLASKGAWYVLRLIALPGEWFMVEVNGNTLEVIRGGTTYPLNVAEACSGMRMVIAFVALAAMVGLFSCRQWWQRIALLLLSVPVALLMNVLRVAILGLLTMVDANLAKGEAHMLIGTLLLVPALFLFLGVVSLLNRMMEEREGQPGGGGA
jgi:exosortase